ncbi:MAG TPA: glycosyltransferase [Pyrinomonadaceae bacterium]|nr:glycosyltransferase [Pyrinomonadaceae bacterium]
MERRTTLDIVICTYNNAALLDRALAAISAQRIPSGVEWQVLVVNNNCTDETPQVVEQHERRNALPLRMVCELRQGLTAARVCGVRNTAGEWIAFVDDDCLLAGDWVEQAVRFAAEHPRCGAFGGQVSPEWETPPPPFVLNHRYAYACKYHGETAHRRPWLAGAGMVVRRDALDACGWTEKQFLADRTAGRLVSGGDMEIGLRIAAISEVWYNPACKLRHVIPQRRMSLDYLRRIVRGLGASRHNASALTWRGSYAGWVLYSAAFSVGFGALGALQLVRALFNTRSGDVPLAFAPVRGWWSAMWEMSRMDAEERRQLIGCAATSGRAN